MGFESMNGKNHFILEVNNKILQVRSPNNIIKCKKAVRTNQGSVISLNTALIKTNPQKCCSGCNPTNGPPNHPRSLNRLHQPCCENSKCVRSNCNKPRGLSNRNLTKRLVNTKTYKCCKNKINNKMSNSDLINQIVSKNIQCKPKNNCSTKCYNTGKNKNVMCYDEFIRNETACFSSLPKCTERCCN